jgi:hypothetical protein
MRRIALLIVITGGAVTVLARASEQQASPGAPADGAAIERASKVLAATREALGSEKSIAAIKSFVATGRTRQIRGNNLVPIEFEIACQLPDRYVRTDEIPAQDTDPSTAGFNGEGLIQIPPPAPGRAGGPPGGALGRGPLNPATQRVLQLKQDFARLTLGMFATSFAAFPLTFKYAAEAEAPEGKADVLDVAGPENFSARLVIEQRTHLPVMLVWQQPPTTVIVRVPGQPAVPTPPGAVVIDAPAPPGTTATPDERDRYATTVATLRRQALAQAKPVDYRLYYADFRETGGLKLPFRLRRAVAGETIEETTFDRFRTNTNIDGRKFEVVK